MCKQVSPTSLTSSPTNCQATTMTLIRLTQLKVNANKSVQSVAPHLGLLPRLMTKVSGRRHEATRRDLICNFLDASGGHYIQRGETTVHGIPWQMTGPSLTTCPCLATLSALTVLLDWPLGGHSNDTVYRVLERLVEFLILDLPFLCWHLKKILTTKASRRSAAGNMMRVFDVISLAKLWRNAELSRNKELRHYSIQSLMLLQALGWRWYYSLYWI